MAKTKICTNCRNTKDISKFDKNKGTKDGFTYYCKECRKTTRKKTNIAKTKKQQLVDYKGSKCSVCGYNKCLSALTFHHCKGEKEFDITKGIFSGYSIEKLKQEADKCILVCFNCHMEIHYG